MGRERDAKRSCVREMLGERVRQRLVEPVVAERVDPQRHAPHDWLREIAGPAGEVFGGDRGDEEVPFCHRIRQGCRGAGRAGL